MSSTVVGMVYWNLLKSLTFTVRESTCGKRDTMNCDANMGKVIPQISELVMDASDMTTVGAKVGGMFLYHLLPRFTLSNNPS
jgi:hypothetical protein